MVYGDGYWSDIDPDIVFSMNLDEQAGLAAADKARFGFTGTLNGGPARVLRQPTQIVTFGTTTVSMLTPQYINFTRTVGEDITSAADSSGLLEFSGKSCMFCATFSLDSFTTGERSAWSYTNDINGVCGWHFRISGINNLVFGFIGISDNSFNRNIGDLNPHSYCAWHDGSNILTLFIDGVQTNRFSATGAFTGCLGLGLIKVAKRDNAAHAEFGGGVSYLKIRKNVTVESNARELAKAYTNHVNGRLNQ